MKQIINQHNRQEIQKRIQAIKEKLNQENERGNGWTDLIMAIVLGSAILYLGIHYLIYLIR